ncbi:hypothetical protein IT568_02575 [bacterium]|nr:hypothetical protein [bacterium]
MEFVVNEWLPEFSIPTATNEERKLVTEFLNLFLSKKDVLFVKRESEFFKKIYRYSSDRKFGYDPKTKELFNKFIKLVLLDSSKCKILENQDLVEIPQKTKEKLVPPFDSDFYLFESACLTNEKVIVTTDKRLFDQTENDEFFKIILLENFMEKYKNKQG